MSTITVEEAHLVAVLDVIQVREGWGSDPRLLSVVPIVGSLTGPEHHPIINSVLVCL